MCQYKVVCASLEQRHIEVTSAEPQGAWWRGMEVTSIICHLDWLFIPIKTEYSISQPVLPTTITRRTDQYIVD